MVFWQQVHTKLVWRIPRGEGWHPLRCLFTVVWKHSERRPRRNSSNSTCGMYSVYMLKVFWNHTDNIRKTKGGGDSRRYTMGMIQSSFGEGCIRPAKISHRFSEPKRKIILASLISPNDTSVKLVLHILVYFLPEYVLIYKFIVEDFRKIICWFITDVRLSSTLI